MCALCDNIYFHWYVKETLPETIFINDIEDCLLYSYLSDCYITFSYSENSSFTSRVLQSFSVNVS